MAQQALWNRQVEEDSGPAKKKTEDKEDKRRRQWDGSLSHMNCEYGYRCQSQHRHTCSVCGPTTRGRTAHHLDLQKEGRQPSEQSLSTTKVSKNQVAHALHTGSTAQQPNERNRFSKMWFLWAGRSGPRQHTLFPGPRAPLAPVGSGLRQGWHPQRVRLPSSVPSLENELGIISLAVRGPFPTYQYTEQYKINLWFNSSKVLFTGLKNEQIISLHFLETNI